MTTIKSDDIKGRNELYSAITRGYSLPKPHIPEGF
jgi:DNA-directed RNA polymerase subunit beta